jgi:hypothetical protein
MFFVATADNAGQVHAFACNSNYLWKVGRPATCSRCLYLHHRLTLLESLRVFRATTSTRPCACRKASRCNSQRLVSVCLFPHTCTVVTFLIVQTADVAAADSASDSGEAEAEAEGAGSGSGSGKSSALALTSGAATTVAELSTALRELSRPAAAAAGAGAGAGSASTRTSKTAPDVRFVDGLRLRACHSSSKSAACAVCPFADCDVSWFAQRTTRALSARAPRNANPLRPREALRSVVRCLRFSVIHSMCSMLQELALEETTSLLRYA